MSTETSIYTKEARFKVGDEYVQIDRFGEDDYSVYLKNGDCSIRGTYLDIVKELLKFGSDLTSATPLQETTYHLFYEERGIQNMQDTKVRGTDLDDALCNFAMDCMNGDHTGIFFPLDDADVEELEKDPFFHKVYVDGAHLGIILVDYEAEAA